VLVLVRVPLGLGFLSGTGENDLVEQSLTLQLANGEDDVLSKCDPDAA